MKTLECNFDGLVGPTHHYAGLGVGNLASQTHRGEVSRPRAAALQGLDKMRLLRGWGIPQAILLPAPRPNLELLHGLGWQRRPLSDMLRQVADEAPLVLSAAYSASSMWVANAATVTPSCDSSDGRMHLTVANLCSSIHRSHEAASTMAHLSVIFNSPSFALHSPLPGGWAMRDEGAANHMRLWHPDAPRGIHVLVHGIEPPPAASRFFARQSLQASQAVARLHQLPIDSVCFVPQHPQAIDGGVFHNDVIATSYGDRLLYHELAFANGESDVDQIRQSFRSVTGRQLKTRCVTQGELPLTDAVASYLFNSQIVSTSADGSFDALAMVCPMQCQEIPAADRVLQSLQRDGWIDRVAFVELRQSMHNGGGPACLRLRVPMNDQERAVVPRSVWWNESIDARLRSLIETRYPETLGMEVLREEAFAEESLETYRALKGIVLGS
jgi:succinylarginine dihydrolase